MTNNTLILTALDTARTAYDRIQADPTATMTAAEKQAQRTICHCLRAGGQFSPAFRSAFRDARDVFAAMG